MLINGEWIDSISKEVIEIINPATDEKIDVVPLGKAADIKLAVEFAKKGYKINRGIPVIKRAAYLTRASELILENLEDLRTTMNNEVVYTREVVTTGEPEAVRLTVAEKNVGTSFDDVAHIIVEIIDVNGNRVPLAENLIEIKIEGDARVIGMENGNMSDHDPLKSSKRRAYNGLCLALLQSNLPGKISVEVTSEGLKGAQTDIEFVHTKELPTIK